MDWWVFFIALFVVTSFMFLLICKITILENRIACNDEKIYALSTKLHTVVSRHMSTQNEELSKMSTELRTVMSQHIPDQNSKNLTLTDNMMDEHKDKDKLWERLLECDRTHEKIQAEIKTSTPQVCELKLLSSHLAVINDIQTLKGELAALDRMTHNLYLLVMNPAAAKLYENVEDD